ncbi:DUF3732 domain-containing protein [Yersinia enterocolitica]|uniref:DUF3732 domain-containing protein n=1 Tax=Yersinia enterocolitica TaxID=630 RepID=UPI003F430E63
MKFYISDLILWPKDTNNKIRTLHFNDGEINIIHGISGTGKSSIIAIIDHCLGSLRCSIPVGIIRDKVRWFGLKVYIKDQFYLIARHTPSYSSSTNECHISIIDINSPLPELITGNYNLAQFKQRINNISQITNISINGDYDEDEKNDPPSFRDLTSFNFQPQHIVANPNTLFYRADSYNHKEKLKKVLPYAFRIIDALYLVKERELTRTRKLLEKKEKQYNLLQDAYKAWDQDILMLWDTAIELGLVRNEENISLDDKFKKIEELNNTFNVGKLDSLMNRPDYQYTNNKFFESQMIEESHQREVDSINKKIRSYRGITYNFDKFKNAIKIEKDSLLNINWIKSNLKKDTECIVCGSVNNNFTPIINNLEKDKKRIDELTDAFVTSPIVDKQLENLNIELNKKQEQLNKSRKTRLQLELLNNSAKDSLSKVFLLIGNIQSFIKALKTIEKNDDLSKEINALNKKINDLSSFFSENEYKNKEYASKYKIDNLIKGYARNFKVAQHNKASLDYRELTIAFDKSGSYIDKEYLWEIGSGANWMGYHLAAFLAFHEYFISPNGCGGDSPVFSFLVIDQPSQVYFPSSSSGINALDQSDDEFEKIKKERDTDINETQRIFKILSRGLERTEKDSNEKYQIIVLEHAGKNIWDNINYVNEVAHWNSKNDGLIPEEWI